MASRHVLDRLFMLLCIFSMAWTATGQAKEEKSNMHLSSAQQAKSVELVSVSGGSAVNAQFNPHWNSEGCDSCHIQKPDRRGLHLTGRSVDETCNDCHDIVSSHSYIHPSGVVADKKMLHIMPKSYRASVKRGDGKVTCITCHDLPMQCLPERAKEKGLNPLFFRGGPFSDRSDICFNCHDETAYARLNPHDQINKQGVLQKNRCGVCHQDIEELSALKSIKDAKFNIKGDLTRMCTGCHPWKPHPGGSFNFAFSGKSKKGPDHLVVPSKYIKQQMKRQQERFQITLPLDPVSGKIFCATCHNPHEKGVIRNKRVAQGADSKNRLRKQQICEMCHDK